MLFKEHGALDQGLVCSGLENVASRGHSGVDMAKSLDEAVSRVSSLCQTGDNVRSSSADNALSSCRVSRLDGHGLSPCSLAGEQKQVDISGIEVSIGDECAIMDKNIGRTLDSLQCSLQSQRPSCETCHGSWSRCSAFCEN